MAIVYGQLESLKKIKDTFDLNGISRFNSIRQVKDFIKNYEKEKEELFYNIERQFEAELDTLQTDAYYHQKKYDSLKEKVESRLNKVIGKLDKKCIALKNSSSNNGFIELGNWYLLQLLLGVKLIYMISHKLIFWLQSFKVKKNLEETLKRVSAFNANRQLIISERLAMEYNTLEHVRTIVNDINPLIAGAIGEHLVSKELEKLSDSFVLINDFSLSFNPPIFDKKNSDRIYSIQIDHLLVTNSGIFIIETKNWSKKSIESLDLRSPIDQIQRTSYALYVLLNSNDFIGNSILKQHHWGKKELPIRSVIAMINHKPNEKFKFVAIKNLKELNGYIDYFEPIFDESEVINIANQLRSLYA